MLVWMDTESYMRRVFSISLVVWISKVHYLEEGRLWNVGEERERSTGAAASSFSSSSSCCSPLYLPTLGSSTNSCSPSLSSELGFEIRKFLRSSLQVLFEEGACTITLLLFLFSNSELSRVGEDRRSEVKVFAFWNFLWQYLCNRLSSVTSSWSCSCPGSTLISTWRGRLFSRSGWRLGQ